MQPYLVDDPVFCKNCKQMRLVEPGADKIEANMHCVVGCKWIIDSYVDGHGHYNVREGAWRNLPFCSSRNVNGICQSYIPKS